jgi:hypothetical protein
MTTETLALVAAIAGHLAAIARLFNVFRPLYGWLPLKAQPVVIALVAGLPPLAEALLAAKSTEQVLLAVASGVTAFFIAVKGTPPSPGDGKPVAAKPLSQRPRAGFDAEFRIWRPRWATALSFAFAWMALCSLLAGCSLFTREAARSAQDIAHDLCVMHYGKAKPALSLDDIARTYCKSIDPWLDSLLAAEKLAAAKARAQKP